VRPVYAVPRGDRLDAQDRRPHPPRPGPAGGFEDPRRGRPEHGHYAGHDDLRPGRRGRLAGEDDRSEVPRGAGAVHQERTEEAAVATGGGPLNPCEGGATMNRLTLALAVGCFLVAATSRAADEVTANDLKQIGLAYHSHHDATGKPPGKAEDLGKYIN